ncbi:MAG: SGNH/GDSL hydrolase family protein [Solobacterium sp.]|nr:SGNH/GDSL hydrolase family protein [Solobacterium sp.]
MKKMIRWIILFIGIIAVCIAGLFLYIDQLPGNASAYSFEEIEVLENSPLQEKKICVLGSSVTDGMAAKGNAIGEYIAKRFRCDYVKEAVIGTTLADHGFLSYVDRIRKINTEETFDLFICQLSTNDATKKYNLGNTGSSDVKTITGAIEYIICYVKDTWNCPIVFFTNSKYENDGYEDMVQRVYDLQDKYDIGIIDLWNNPAFNDITDEQRKLYMYDKIHPTMAGYRDWWGPEVEKQLLKYLEE